MSRRHSFRRAARYGAFGALAFASLQTPVARAQETIVTVTAGSAAFATGIFDSVIRDNVVVDIGTTRATVLENSVLGNLGIVQINQDAGIGANQANMVLIAVAAGANPVYGVSFTGTVQLANNTFTVDSVTRTNVIVNVLNGSAGIVQINQNSGTLNTNLNFLGLALSLGQGNAAVSLSDGNLAAATTNIQFTATGPITQSNVISGLSNFSGIAQISQTNGDGNLGANAMVINFSVINLQ